MEYVRSESAKWRSAAAAVMATTSLNSSKTHNKLDEKTQEQQNNNASPSRFKNEQKLQLALPGCPPLNHQPPLSSSIENRTVSKALGSAFPLKMDEKSNKQMEGSLQNDLLPNKPELFSIHDKVRKWMVQ